MIQLLFKPTFIRQLNKLEDAFLPEVFEKIELFKDVKNHQSLKVHKLHGALSDYYGFSINYQTRIVFQYLTKKEVVLMAIGDHDVYK